MKKWPIIVAILYALVCLTLIIPLDWVTDGCKWAKLADVNLVDIGRFFMTWQMRILAVLMVLAQLALLCIPVAVAAERPVARRHIITTVLAAAFMMGVLAFGAAASIVEFGYKPGEKGSLWPIVAIVLGSWVFWALWFYRCANTRRPDGKLKKITRFLWTGSILELLIAIPTHIVARQRNYCCAGLFTFVGITCGMSVMLFAFGPAVYFLFVERWKRLHPDNPQT